MTGDQTHGFYSSKVFTGWDFGVTSEVAAKLNRKSIYLELAVSSFQAFSVSDCHLNCSASLRGFFFLGM